MHTNVYQNLGLQCAGHYSMGLKYTNIFTNYKGCIGKSLCVTLWHMQNAPTSHRKKLKIFHDISCFLLLHHFMCFWLVMSSYTSQEAPVYLSSPPGLWSTDPFSSSTLNSRPEVFGHEKWWAMNHLKVESKQKNRCVHSIQSIIPLHPLQNFHGWFT